MNFSRTGLRTFVVGASIIAAACSGDSTTDLKPSSLDTSAGNQQSAVVGTTLPQALVVHAFGPNGEPLSGKAVTFSLGTAAGSLSTTTATTDAQGNASTTWTLGTAAGTQVVSAVVDGVGGVAFVATALASTPAVVETAAGNEQQAAAGATLTDPLTVTVLDEFGNPVPSAEVKFTPTSGEVSHDVVETDASGTAQVFWTLGTSKGTQSVTAEVNGKTVTFTAIAQ